MKSHLVSIAFALALFGLAAPAFGEVMHYSKCQLVKGKTFEDVQKWATDWRVLKKTAKVDYRVRILIPHVAGELGADEFYIEGGSSTLQSHAAAWNWWYTDAAAMKSNQQLVSAATCDTGSVFRTTD